MAAVTELDTRRSDRLEAALRMIAPGTELRTGIDDVLRQKSGGLFVVGEPSSISFLFSGGVPLDLPFSANILGELAKMDGAIVLDADARRLVYANVQLMPDPLVHTSETGTRHRTAERVAKQTDALVIAISQERDVISLYVDEGKYVLEELRILIARANQALNTLDKYRARLDQVETRLTALEFEGVATLHDALGVLQRAEMTSRMAREIERYIVELGAESRMIAMQLDEMMVGVLRDLKALVRDYRRPPSDGLEGDQALIARLHDLPDTELFDLGALAVLLGYDTSQPLDLSVTPRGYRALARIPRLPRGLSSAIAERFGDLDGLLKAGVDELSDVDGVGDARARDITDGLRRLQETNFVDRHLQA